MPRAPRSRALPPPQPGAAPAGREAAPSSPSAPAPAQPCSRRPRRLGLSPRRPRTRTLHPQRRTPPAARQRPQTSAPSAAAEARWAGRLCHLAAALPPRRAAPPSARVGRRDGVIHSNVSLEVTRKSIGGAQGAPRHRSSKRLSNGSAASAPLRGGGGETEAGSDARWAGGLGRTHKHSARHPSVADGVAGRTLTLPCPLAGREGCAAEGTPMAQQGGQPGRCDAPVRSRASGAAPLRPPHSNQRLPRASSQEPQMLRVRLKTPSAALHSLQLGPDLTGDNAVSSPLGTLLALTRISANP